MEKSVTWQHIPATLERLTIWSQDTTSWSGSRSCLPAHSCNRPAGQAFPCETTVMCRHYYDFRQKWRHRKAYHLLLIPQSKPYFPNAGYGPLVGPEVSSVSGNRPAFFFFNGTGSNRKYVSASQAVRVRAVCFRCICVCTLGHGVTWPEFLLWVLIKAVR